LSAAITTSSADASELAAAEKTGDADSGASTGSSDNVMTKEQVGELVVDLQADNQRSIPSIEEDMWHEVTTI